MEEFSNKISPLINKIFSSQVFDRIIGKEELAASTKTEQESATSGAGCSKSCYSGDPVITPGTVTGGSWEVTRHMSSRYRKFTVKHYVR